MASGQEGDVVAQISGLPKVVVGFWAPWEYGSRAVVGQVIGAMASDTEHFDSLTGIPMDVSKYEDAAFELGVSMLPYFGYYRHGRKIAGLSSSSREEVLEAARSWAAAMDEDEPMPPPLVQKQADKPPASSRGDTYGSRKPATDLSTPFELVNQLSGQPPLRIFVAGDRSKVGKSSVCLGILGGLLKLGFQPEDVAYIKPATQCESAQLVNKWCDAKGIANRGLGPVIFYKGFTREFLKGNVGTSQDLLADVDKAVREIGAGRKVVLVDGVGYPAVGSICGISNADIVSTLGCPVVIVGRPGVGDAVDSFNLNACFFTSRGLRVLGGIFNRLPLEGFYSLEACSEAVSGYFRRFQTHMQPYGFLPERPELLNVREEIEAEHSDKTGGTHAVPTVDGNQPAFDPDTKRILLAESFIDMFLEYVDLKQLVRDVYAHERQAGKQSGLTVPSFAPLGLQASRLPATSEVPSTALAPSDPALVASSPVVCSIKRKTREEIEAAAKKQGAKSGG